MSTRVTAATISAALITVGAIAALLLLRDIRDDQRRAHSRSR